MMPFSEHSLISTARVTKPCHCRSQYVPLPAYDLERAAAAALEQQPADVSDMYQEEAEKRLNDLYNCLAKCKDMTEQVRGL